MSLQEKVINVKAIINLVCEVIPALVSIIKEVIIALKEIKTV